MGRAAILAVLLALSACAPKPPPAPPPLVFDCKRGFEALKAGILAEPGVGEAPHDPGEPYRYYNSEDGRTSYVITLPGGAGHPAILRQQAVEGGMANTGCPYGDTAGYARLQAYIEALAKVRHP